MKKLTFTVLTGIMSALAFTAGARQLTVADLCPLTDDEGTPYGQAYTVYYGDFTFDGLPVQTYGDCKLTPVAGSTNRVKMSNFGYGLLGDVELQLNADNTITLVTTQFPLGHIQKCAFESERVYGRAAYWNMTGYEMDPKFSNNQLLWSNSHNATTGDIVSNPVTDMGNDEYDIVFSKDTYEMKIGSVAWALNPMYFDKIQIHTYTPTATAKYTVQGPSTGGLHLTKKDVPTRVNINGNSINIVNFANRGIQYDVQKGYSPEYGENVNLATGKYFSGTLTKVDDDKYSLYFPYQEVWGDVERDVAFYVNYKGEVCPWKIILTDDHSTTGVYNKYHAQKSSHSTSGVTGWLTLGKPTHKSADGSQWVHFQPGGSLHTMAGATITLDDFSVYRTGHDNRFTGYEIDSNELADMTHDVMMGIDVYGYGTVGGNGEEYIYVRGMLYPDTDTSAKYVDGYELMIVPGWHESASGWEFAGDNGHAKAFNIESEEYFHHEEYNFKGQGSLRHAVSGISEEKTDEEIAADLNAGLKFNRLVPVADLPYTDAKGHYTLFVKTNYVPESGLAPTYHSLSYVTDGNTTAIESIEGLDQAATISGGHGEITVTGTDGTVEVYTLSGMQMYSGPSGSIAVSRGIYMVKAGSQVKKVTVK